METVFSQSNSSKNSIVYHNGSIFWPLQVSDGTQEVVAYTNRSRTVVTRNPDCNGRRHSCCAFCLHTFLVQKVYKNILVLITGFCVLHLVFKEKTIAFLVVAISVLFLSAVSEKAAVLIDKSWLWLGEKIGKVNAAILLFLIYYLILTPIAFLSRIGKKDPLQLNAPEKSNFVFNRHRYTAKDLENPW